MCGKLNKIIGAEAAGQENSFFHPPATAAEFAKPPQDAFIIPPLQVFDILGKMLVQKCRVLDLVLVQKVAEAGLNNTTLS